MILNLLAETNVPWVPGSREPTIFQAIDFYSPRIFHHMGGAQFVEKAIYFNPSIRFFKMFIFGLCFVV
jgi:hypothetical protein